MPNGLDDSILEEALELGRRCVSLCIEGETGEILTSQIDEYINNKEVMRSLIRYYAGTLAGWLEYFSDDASAEWSEFLLAKTQEQVEKQMRDKQ